MTTLVSRHIKKDEADWLGIKEGWYGTKVSGTLMTARFASNEECESEIKKLAKAAAAQA
jgi:hypothetical protein